jgi:hypothetical protein
VDDGTGVTTCVIVTHKTTAIDADPEAIFDVPKWLIDKKTFRSDETHQEHQIGSTV